MALSGCGGSKKASQVTAWVEIGPGGTAVARVVTTAALCPPIAIDGRSQPMVVRAAPDPPDFAVLICEAALPAEARRAAVEGQPLPLLRGDPKRIAVLGDTGCRLDSGAPPQACNEPTAWPFAELARSVADWQPELIVHVGDYLYREAPCPPGDDGCAGSPWGYNWPTVEADFFAPARPLLRAAPLVFTRGNHESCNRAGPVWFRFLDPRPFPTECADYTEPYAIALGALQLLIFDSSAASDTSVSPAQVAIYRPQFEAVRRVAGAHAFFVTHRPMWVFGHLGEMDGMETLFRDNPTLQAASDNDLPAGVELVLSGHIHLFQLLTFELPPLPLRPPQIVVGDSGTELDPAITTPLAGLTIAGATVKVGETRDQFGFVTLEPEGAGWRATLRDVSGRSLLKCAISDRTAQCPLP